MPDACLYNFGAVGFSLFSGTLLEEDYDSYPERQVPSIGALILAWLISK
jgi:hypothetical protein